MTIAQSLSTFGFAPVIAYTKPAAATPYRGLRAETTWQARQCFSQQEGSQLAAATAALAEASDQADAVAPAPQPEDAAVRVYPNLGIMYGTVDRAGLAALREEPSVAKVTGAPQLSLIRPVAAAPATPDQGSTWGLQRLGVPELWASGLTGAGVGVAHLDTGVDVTHPALTDAVTAFAEFDIAGRLVPGATARDSDTIQGHGTHTAATLAGRAVEGRQVGVAPGAALHCAMVIEGGDLVARILGGMDWAVGAGVRVLSLSLGLRGFQTDFLGLIDVLRDNGVLPIIAVGNEGPGTSRSPGNYPRALSVGYHDELLAVSDKSSSQRFPRRSQPLVPDVVAPGEAVISAKNGGGWHALSGSSMAVPHVAGLAALLLQAKPTATVAALERAILASASLGTMPKERANRGAVHGPTALAALKP